MERTLPWFDSKKEPLELYVVQILMFLKCLDLNSYSEYRNLDSEVHRIRIRILNVVVLQRAGGHDPYRIFVYS